MTIPPKGSYAREWAELYVQFRRAWRILKAELYRVLDPYMPRRG